MVPNDFKNAIAAINFGEPVVLRAAQVRNQQSLIGLAGALNGKMAAQISRCVDGVLTRLMGKSLMT